MIFQPDKTSLSHAPLRLPTRYLTGCVILQLLYLPILWGHTSDSAQLLGRFSYGYIIVIVIQVLILITLLLILFRQQWITIFMQRHQQSWQIVYLCVGCIIVGLFVLTQLRSIHFKASNYLFATAIMLLGAIAWQLTDGLSSIQLHKLRLVVIWWHGCVLILITAIVFTALYGRGFVTPRILSPVAYLLVLLGMIWGGYLAYLLKHHIRFGLPSSQIKLTIGVVVLAMLLFVSTGIFLGHAALIPDLQLYSSEWDARHQQIIDQRDQGQSLIEVNPLSFDMADWVRVTTISQDPANRCAEQYYGLQSIVVSG